MQIQVPEDLGGKLRVVNEDTYNAKIQDVFLGKSKKDNPKATVKYVLLSEFSGKKNKDYITTIGENILETFSLLPNAIWNLNDLYVEVTGERLPQGDFDEEAFESLLKDALIGAEGKIVVVTDNASGEERSTVDDRAFG